MSGVAIWIVMPLFAYYQLVKAEKVTKVTVFPIYINVTFSFV